EERGERQQPGDVERAEDDLERADGGVERAARVLVRPFAGGRAVPAPGPAVPPGADEERVRGEAGDGAEERGEADGERSAPPLTVVPDRDREHAGGDDHPRAGDEPQ